VLNRVYRAGWALSKKIIIEVFHAFIALGIVLTYLYAISLFKPEYVILLRGVVWSRVYSIDLTYETLILLAVALAVFVCVYAIDGFRAVKLAKVSVYVLAILTVVCGLSLAYWIAYMWSPQVSQDHSLIRLSELDAGIFHIYAPLYPLLLLVMLYVWLPPAIGRVFKRRVRLSVGCSRALGRADNHKPSDNTFVERFGLASILLLSIVLPLIPYLPPINPDFKPVSVDIRYYSMWLDYMLTADYWGAVEYAFCSIGNGNRPLYLMLLYCLVSLGIPKQLMLNFEALLISPFFALAVYYMAKRLSGSGIYAVSASLAGLLGFNMTVGMFAGLYAAWIALIPFYICIMSTLSLRESRWALAGSILTSTALLYIHPWTWCILMAILALHLIIQTLKSVEKGGNLKVDKQLLAVLASNISMDSLKTATSPYHGGLTCSIDILTKGKYFEIYVPFGFEYLLRLPQNLYRLSTTYMCGLFYNPFHMLLAFIGVLSFLNKKDEYSKLILLWVATISAIFPFGSLAFQSHLLFAMPFPILIAEGLWALSRLLARFDSRLPKLLQAFFITSSLTYTVRALCNLI
jgi:hypothetical protein